jgi:hypothetical protein
VSQTEHPQPESSAKPDKDTLDVFVFPPRDPNLREEFDWSKHLEVGKAAEQAAAKFGYSGGQPTLSRDGKPLDRTKQLVAEHVKDGEVLGLVDVAGGV